MGIFDYSDEVGVKPLEEIIKTKNITPLPVENVRYGDEPEFSSNGSTSTDTQFKVAINNCFNIFSDKLDDYGPSWRIMRPMSVTDQIYIKASRIRKLEETGTSAVGDGCLCEFQALVNYGIVGLIQLSLGYSDNPNNDITNDIARELYKKYAEFAYDLMIKKNRDYNEAWRLMRINSYTDFILTKIFRVMEIEEHGGKTKVSEPIESNYYDIINYAIFGIIKLTEQS